MGKNSCECLRGFTYCHYELQHKKTIDTYNKQGLISSTISDTAVNVIKKDNPKRIFNDYNVGESLIYNEIPVFFDGRADLYAQDNILADGMSLMYLENINEDRTLGYIDVDEMIEEYEIDSIIILKSRPLYTYVSSHTKKYQMIYEDDEVAYFRIKNT